MPRTGARRRVMVWSLLVLLTATTRLVSADGREPAGPERRGSQANIETKVTRPARDRGKSPECVVRSIPFTTGENKRVIRIDIHETIDLGLAPFVQRVVEEAGEDPSVALILLHMNTPGGRVDAAQQIKDALLKSKVPTATFIDTHALSAGALIAYATDFIIMADGSTIGAATPINISQKGEAQAVGEKFVSAVRAIFQSTAEAKNRDGLIAESMVDKDVEIEGLIASGKLLTLAKDDALAWCVADLTANDVPGVLTVLNLQGAEVEHRELNWAERVARVITDPTISGLLMSFGFLGLMMELYTAGFGIAGFIGLGCLLVFFSGHLIVNLVGAEEIALFAVGMALLGVEVFVTPGFGVAGVLGIGALVASLVLSLVGGDVSFSWQVGGLGSAIRRTAFSLTGTIVLFAILARYLPRTGMFGRLVLAGAVEETSFGSVEANSLPTIGTEGIASTHIRGSGKAEFGGVVTDVIGEGTFITPGEAVVVVEARPGRVVVSGKTS